MFRKYRRTAIAEMRDLQPTEGKHLLIENGISVSKEDLILDEEEFSKGKVARNPKNHNDQWYIAYKYFAENFEEYSEDVGQPDREPPVIMKDTPQKIYLNIGDIGQDVFDEESHLVVNQLEKENAELKGLIEKLRKELKSGYKDYYL